MPASVSPPAVVASASVLAAPVSLTAPLTVSASALVSAKPAVVVKASSVLILLAPPRLAVVAVPVSELAVIEPLLWLMVPAESRTTWLDALTLPPRAMPPALVVSDSALAAPVSLTGPVTASDWLLVSAKPAVVLKVPSVVMVLDWPSATLPVTPLLDCSVLAVITPAVWVMPPPVVFRSTTAPLTLAPSAMPPVPAVISRVPVEVLAPTAAPMVMEPDVTGADELPDAAISVRLPPVAPGSTAALTARLLPASSVRPDAA